MSQNWGSGTAHRNTHTNTTNKFFNPQAIIDQLNRNQGRFGQNAYEHNLIFGGKNYTGGQKNPYKLPGTPPPAGPPPGGTPQPHPGPGITPPVTPPPDTQPSGGDGGGPRPHGPRVPLEPDSQTSKYGETPVGSMNARFSPVNQDDSPSDGPGPGITPPVTPPPSGGLGHNPVTQGPSTPPVPHVPPGGPPPDIATGGDPQPIPGDEPPPGGDPNDPNSTVDPGGADGGLIGALMELLSGQGYSDEEKNAIMENTAGVNAAQKGSAQAQLANHLASSGNAAGYGGAMAALDTGAAKTASDQARQNEIDFANEGERRKELATAGLTQLLGINTAADTALNAQNSGLAALGSGSETSGADDSSFENQNYQATPDPSTKPKSTTNPTGGTTPGKPGTPGPTPGTTWGQNGTLYDVNGYVINPETGAMVGPNGEDIPGTEGGHQPPDGSDGPYPGTTWGPNGTLYGPGGEVVDPSTGEPVDQYGNPAGPAPEPEPGEPGGPEGPPAPEPEPGEPGGPEGPPAPDDPGVLPDPNGGEPDPGGVEGDPSNPVIYNPGVATAKSRPDAYKALLRRLQFG